MSQLQSNTSRLNGAKSHGPITIPGREKSSQNALKHGGASARGLLLRSESAADFEELHNFYLATYKPDGPEETTLVGEMAAARWRASRFDEVETELIDDEMTLQESKYAGVPAGKRMARAFRELAEKSVSLTLASRYQSRQHRIHDRAYKTLRALKKERLAQVSEDPKYLEVSWIEPEERRVRDLIRARQAVLPDPPEDATTKLPNEPGVATNKAANKVVTLESNKAPDPAPPPRNIL
jgi:hypothetical protein